LFYDKISIINAFQPIERKKEFQTSFIKNKKEKEPMVTITSIAEEKIKELIKEEENAVGLRIYVKGGGCSGYQYGMSFEDKTSDDDTIIEKDGVKVIVDSQSAPMLNGAEVDYVDSLQGSGFSIKNPQAKSTCGCGSSFSV
jgi:iron-sulfur cluster insertion protein